MNSTELVPVFTGELNGQPVQVVNARDLWAFLSVTTRFNDWFRERLEQYGFEEGKDFYSISSKSRGRPKADYHITLDTAKELAMVERNEKGRQARRYFIDCERKTHEQPTQPQALPAPVDELPEELRAAIARKANALAVESFEYIRAQLEQRIREQLPDCSPKELLQWLDDIGGPNAELVVLSAHELWEATSRIAVAQWSAHNALTAVHALEQRTGREWYGRRRSED